MHLQYVYKLQYDVIIPLKSVFNITKNIFSIMNNKNKIFFENNFLNIIMKNYKRRKYSQKHYLSFKIILQNVKNKFLFIL